MKIHRWLTRGGHQVTAVLRCWNVFWVEMSNSSNIRIFNRKRAGLLVFEKVFFFFLENNSVVVVSG